MKNFVRIVHLGCPGHFICANRCHYRRHTQIETDTGGFRISTVGDFYPEYDKPGVRQALGYPSDAFFETFVFEITAEQAKGNEGCGCREVKGWGQIEGIRSKDAKGAHETHERLIVKYAALAETGGPA